MYSAILAVVFWALEGLVLEDRERRGLAKKEDLGQDNGRGPQVVLDPERALASFGLRLEVGIFWAVCVLG